MGAIAPVSSPKRKGYFSCAGIAFVALVFWMLLACCFLLFLLALASDLSKGDADIVQAYYAILPLGAISAAFTLMVAMIVLVFLAYGLYGRSRADENRKPAPLAAPLLLACTFLCSTMCAAGLPTVIFLPDPAITALIKGIALAGSGLSCLVSPVALWFAVDTYERLKREDSA
jgi:hypothetical protein